MNRRWPAHSRCGEAIAAFTRIAANESEHLGRMEHLPENRSAVWSLHAFPSGGKGISGAKGRVGSARRS
jgi:hypothetical protein